MLSKETVCILKARQWKSSITTTFRRLWSLMMWADFDTVLLHLQLMHYEFHIWIIRKKNPAQISSLAVLHFHKCGAEYKPILNLMLLFFCNMFSLASSSSRIFVLNVWASPPWESKILTQMTGGCSWLWWPRWLMIGWPASSLWPNDSGAFLHVLQRTGTERISSIPPTRLTKWSQTCVTDKQTDWTVGKPCN